MLLSRRLAHPRHARELRRSVAVEGGFCRHRSGHYECRTDARGCHVQRTAHPARLSVHRQHTDDDGCASLSTNDDRVARPAHPCRSWCEADPSAVQSVARLASSSAASSPWRWVAVFANTALADCVPDGLRSNDDIRSSTGEVALDALLDLIEWCRSERSNLQRQLCALKSGKFRIGENTGTGWVDTTAVSIERIAGSISELDQILAAYERSAKASRSVQ